MTTRKSDIDIVFKDMFVLMFPKSKIVTFCIRSIICLVRHYYCTVQRIFSSELILTLSKVICITTKNVEFTAVKLKASISNNFRTEFDHFKIQIKDHSSLNSNSKDPDKTCHHYTNKC